MKKHPSLLQRQDGAALAIGLILLLVATLVAVSAMQGTRFQERMASNHYNKAISFNAAEVGAARLIGALNAHEFDVESWASDLQFPSSSDAPAAVFPVNEENNLVNMGWYWAEIPGIQNLAEDDDKATIFEVPVTIFGVSRRPEQSNDSGANLALTRLDVLVGVRDVPPGGGSSDAGLNLVGPLGSFEVPNSNALEVCNLEDATKCTNQAKDEDKIPVGPAVATLNSSDAEKIKTDLQDENRLHNYIGTDPQIAEGDFADLWLDAGKMQEFLKAVCLHGSGATCTDGEVPDGTVVNKNQLKGPGNVTVIGGGGTTEIEFKGNDAGKGILIVEGNLRTKGTPQWEGLIIVLGGEFHITGGGNGGIDGALYLLNLDMSKDPWETGGEVTFKSDGGGNAKFNHNCDAVLDAVELLKPGADNVEEPNAWDLFQDAHGCDPNGGTGPGETGFTEYSIITWSEVLL